MKKIANKGFTLIELLVVVAIIAILALIVLLALNPVEMARRSRDSRRLSDLGTLRKAIDLSLSDGKSLKGTFVAGGTAAWVGVDNLMLTTSFGGTNGQDISKYLSVTPQDPAYDAAGGAMQIATSGCTAPATGTVTKATITYEYSSDGNVYILRSRLESMDNCKTLSQDGNTDEYYELGTEPGLAW